MSSKIKDYLLFFGVASVSIMSDQWTKWWVRENIEFGGQWMPSSLSWLSPYARIVHWYNSGAAFGIFQDGNLVFTILAFIVVGALIYYFPQTEKDDWLLKLAMGLQLGGAIGNLIDRLMMGKVTDFISIANFPVFNIADASISVGVLVLLAGVWLREQQEKKRNSGTTSTAETVIDPLKEG